MTQYVFTPDQTLSFAEFLQLMYGVYKVDKDTTLRLTQYTVDEKALAALPENLRKYFIAMGERPTYD